MSGSKVDEQPPVPGETGIGSAWMTWRLRCPDCRVAFTVRVRRYVLFPTDARAVLNIVHGTLNWFSCPACGGRRSADAPVLVLRGDPPILAVHGVPEDRVAGLQRSIADGALGGAPRIVTQQRPEWGSGGSARLR